MDREKVIVGIEHCDRLGCSMCPYKPGGYSPMDCRIQLMRDALAILKEQEAVKPTWSRGKPFCGACGLQIHGGKFCSECGKPILWEGR